jgi:hypothetical protein
LNKIAARKRGKVKDDPQEVIEIITKHNIKIRALLNNIPKEADTNHPTFQQYDQIGEDLLNSLVQN